MNLNSIFQLVGAGLVNVSIHAEQPHPDITFNRSTACGRRLMQGFATAQRELSSALTLRAFHLPKIGKVFGRGKTAGLRQSLQRRRPSRAKLV